MEDLVLWPRRLPDLLEVEAEGGLMVQTDQILPEEQADGDRQDTFEDCPDSLRACQVMGHLQQVRQVSQEDRLEDQDGLLMDRRMDRRMAPVVDHRDLQMDHPVVDHRDLLMDHLVVVVDRQEDPLVIMDQGEVQEMIDQTIALQQLWRLSQGAPSNKQNSWLNRPT